MSRFKSHLNVAELRYFFSPSGAFNRRHPRARRLIAEFASTDFHICEIKEREHHVLIPLGCGAIVTVYASGTVLIQERIYGYGATEAARMLRHIIGTSASWHASVED